MATRSEMLNAISRLLDQCYPTPVPAGPIHSMISLLAEYDAMDDPPIIDDDLLSAAYEFCSNAYTVVPENKPREVFVSANDYADLHELYEQHKD